MTRPPAPRPLAPIEAAVRERLADAIHDLNNLLTVVAGRASLLGSALDHGAGGADEVEAILDAVRGCQRITRSLGELAAGQSPRGASGTGCGSPPAAGDGPRGPSPATPRA